MAAFAVALSLSQQFDFTDLADALPPSQQQEQSSLQQSPQESPLHFVSQVQLHSHESPQQVLQSGQQHSESAIMYPIGKGINAIAEPDRPATTRQANKTRFMVFSMCKWFRNQRDNSTQRTCTANHTVELHE